MEQEVILMVSPGVCDEVASLAVDPGEREVAASYSSEQNKVQFTS